MPIINTDKQIPETVIDRRTFLRKSAIGLGVGIALDASTRTAAWAMQSRSSPDVVKLEPTAILELRVQLGGSNVLVPGDSAYARTGVPANAMYAHIRPRAIALCRDERDVVACVKWCKKHGVSPVARGGGHSYAGYSTTTGLLIDLGRLNKVTLLDKDTADVQGAALNWHVRKATDRGAYFMPAGTCLRVGVGGLVLGGGIGYNSRWAGLTSDALVSTRIVTAAGEVLEASADPGKNPDLFWACRGGAGGSFGINTSFRFKLKEVPRDPVTFFQLNLEGVDDASSVFAEFNKLMATDESRLNAIARARAVSKDGEDGKADGIDVVSRGQFIGSKRELEGLLASYPVLKRHWEMTEMPFWEAAKRFGDPFDATTLPPPAPLHSFGDISRYANKPISDKAISKHMELLVKCPGRSNDDAGPSGSMWSLGWVGGAAMNRIGRTETAYVHRGMSTLLRPTSAWPVGDKFKSVGNELMSWTREMIAAIADETPNESYQNFPNRVIEDWRQQYYAENLDRLINVKMQYDKGDVFHNAQSIPAKHV